MKTMLHVLILGSWFPSVGWMLLLTLPPVRLMMVLHLVGQVVVGMTLKRLLFAVLVTRCVTVCAPLSREKQVISIPALDVARVRAPTLGKNTATTVTKITCPTPPLTPGPYLVV